jgi:glycosyltransferase involved in cell wall biosynthesis
MACGTPCVVSSHPSLDEASGDAAVRVDPDDVEAIAAGVELALSDQSELARLGLDHSRPFTWLANGRAHLEAWHA